MAKKNENRALVSLMCEECKNINYTEEKNKKNNKYLKEIKTKQKTNNYVAEKREKPEFDDQVEGRNAVLELLESGRDINKILV